MIISGTNENFKDVTKEGIVVVDFFATWCGPCKMLEPILHEVAEAKNIKVITVDIDDCSDIAREYSVMSVPTILILNNGNLVATSTGYKSKEALNKWIEENK